MQLADKFKRLLRNEDGAVAIEYSLIAAAMGVILVPALLSLTDGAAALYQQIIDLMDHPAVAIP